MQFISTESIPIGIKIKKSIPVDDFLVIKSLLNTENLTFQQKQLLKNLEWKQSENLKNGAKFKRNLKRIGAFEVENVGEENMATVGDEEVGTVRTQKVSKKVKKGGSKWN